MNKRLFVLLITLVFLSGLCIVTPNSVALSEITSNEFQDTHIKPVVEFTANYYEPMLKTSINKTFRVTFNELTQKVVERETSQQIVYFINQKNTERLLEPNPSKVFKVENYIDGSIQEKPLDPSLLEQYETGYYYEGFIPSPDQLADYVGYLNGLEFNYIISAERRYEFNSDMKPVSYILEESIPDCPINSSYDSGQQLIITQEGIVKTLALTQKSIPVNIPLQFEEKGLNNTKVIVAVGWLIVLLLAGFFAGLGVYHILDDTHYTEADINGARQKAYEDGYWDGANDSQEEWQRIIDDMWRDKIIDNITYNLLLTKYNEVYANLLKDYRNPYDVGGPLPESDDWTHTIISVLTQAFIITIVIVVIILIIWLIRKTGIFSSKGGSGATTNIFPSSTRAIESLKEIFLQGLSTGQI